MNKSKFLKVLEEETKLTSNECIIVSDILDDHFVFGKKNKDKIINDIKDKLDFTDEKANEIYNITMSIITSNIKEKIKHPFRSKD